MAHKQSKTNRNREQRKLTKTIESVASIPYENWYPEARSYRRNFHLHVGPTNSGKTHDAMLALKAADSGIYLAPLRLLALEVGERLREDGFRCNILTGEGKDLQPGSQMASSTIEMLDTSVHYDVAVIDEAQMIADRDRGGAWTTAILGVDAEDVHVCLAPEALGIVVRLIEDCYDDYEIIEHERKTPLIWQNDPVDLSVNDVDSNQYENNLVGVQSGDAVICFSRQNVLMTAARLNRIGVRTSVIYGALPWTVRRDEARKFREHESDVVVSTDAIGMGLNLPVRRVVFSETEKFDGVTMRPLIDGEIKQIAGRAGRMGLYDRGYVAVSDENSQEDTRIIRDALGADIEPVSSATLSMPYSLMLHDRWPLSSLIREWSKVDIDSLFEDSRHYEREDTTGMLYASLWIEESFKKKPRLSNLVTRHDEISLIRVQCDFDANDQFNLWKTLVRAWFQDRLDGNDDCRRVRSLLPGGRVWATRMETMRGLDSLELASRDLRIESSFANQMGLMDQDMQDAILEANESIDAAIKHLLEKNYD